MVLFAHAGHVLLDSLIYGGPVVVLGASVFLFARFERRLHPAVEDVPDAPAAGPAPHDPSEEQR